MTDVPAAPLPLIGLKYCGGCNPVYERSAIVRRLQVDYPGIRVIPLGDVDPCDFDIVLVILGCGQSNCFDYRPLQGKEGQIVVSCPGDYAKLQNYLDRIKPL